MKEGLENQGPPYQPEVLPHKVAKESGLKLLKKKLSKELMLDDSGEMFITDNTNLKEIARTASHIASKLRRFRQKLEHTGDPRSETAARTEELLARVVDRCLSLSEFSETIRMSETGKTAVDEQKRGLYALAVKQLAEELPELLSNLKDIPVESGLNPETIRNAVKKTLVSVTAIGTLGALLGGDAHQEKSFLEKTPRSLRQKAAPSEKTGASSLLSRPRQGAEQWPTLGGGGIEGEPGRFEAPEPIARVNERFWSSIDDPLWITDVAERTGEHTFRTIEPRLIATGEKVHADVELKPISVRKGYEMSLPAPLGFAAGDVRTKPVVSFTVNENKSSITFHEDNDSVNVFYKVFGAEQEYQSGIPRGSELNRTEETREVIEELRASFHENAPRILNRHLKDFTYVVSDELQRILEKMPGSMEEKAGTLKVGSCNTLSAYAVGLLNDAGKRAFIGNGFLEDEDYIDGKRPHSKLILFTDGGTRPMTYETTAVPEKHFVHLTFTAEDKAALDEAASAARSSKTSDEQLTAYENFRQKLNEILKKSEYERFVFTGDLPERSGSMYQTVSGLWEKLENYMSSLPRGKEIAVGWAMAVAIDLAGLLAIIAAWKTLKKTKHAIAKKLEEETSKDIIGAFRSIAQGGTIATNEKRDAPEEQIILRRLQGLYEHEPHLEKMYPLTEVEKLPPEKRRDYYKIILMARMFVREPWKMFGMASFIANRASFAKELERLKADGVPVEGWMDRIREYYADEERRKEIESAIPQKADEIMARGVKLAVERLERTNGLDTKNLFKILGIGPADESQTKGKQTPSPAGGEFYEHVPYSPGMDTRTIDWNVYARTGDLVVKTFAEAKHDRKVSAIDVVIDVTEHDDFELDRFTALLLHTQKYKRLDIQSVSFTSYDRVVFRIDGKTIAKMMAEGSTSVRYLIEKIEKLNLEYNLNLFKRKSLRGGAERLRNALSGLPPRRLGLKEDAAVLGIGALGGFDFTKHGKRIDTFLVFKRDVEKSQG
ncbi:MAG: hypothetical protein A2W52_03050 [Candidatus Taylorbacteria bacterium RIFCSPHIGHO2_02_49_25]|uniref:DUF58 domain-containing protein n=1 Tax=Candidatus Taylorbacteria bacterium RIFCSPHIGHO2_02_49_25 TaxID=1802305 RepID=A0A1G2MGD8_9BACT|nr:MAG: hypothetical protein UY62_C0007G0005 [Parcubacteria group bacterium GW2011_GWF2_50_9]OHA19059.1 MAG: hypothetical protein A2759_02975 [Candidatus Taylorbacteria bacterium RIFCSPHIGHO2_01_FULL_49_60]OHA22229.1 MAG: hypothetical protein A2W52_03050 [Candidatus Taylorbacteria bacterium RIFCSPHIGHO2_02_49_25]OHA35174.1 MAG: hypothetical protein A3B27_01625 [Candidatus Taylorbacteria bacterium RIFCSPLOWO2_01_FULL_50_130]OHA36103.1 MAG: hypothetical protein A2W65_02025 [Candidatus Taylorbacte